MNRWLGVVSAGVLVVGCGDIGHSDGKQTRADTLGNAPTPVTVSRGILGAGSNAPRDAGGAGASGGTTGYVDTISSDGGAAPSVPANVGVGTTGGSSNPPFDPAAAVQGGPATAPAPGSTANTGG